MVIGDYLGYSSYGQNAVFGQKPNVQPRPAVILEAERDPQLPDQYRVLTKQEILPPATPSSDAKSSGKKSQNNDPVSRAFLDVADYQPTHHHINVKV